MRLYTIALYNRKFLSDENVLLDVTVKSGVKQLAPNLSDLYAYKNGNLTDVEYKRIFLNNLTQKHTRPFITSIITRGTIAFGCYCAPGAFCHRCLLVPVFKKYCGIMGIPFSYEGEITSYTDVYPTTDIVAYIKMRTGKTCTLNDKPTRKTLLQDNSDVYWILVDLGLNPMYTDSCNIQITLNKKQYVTIH